ncbi:MAG TPA: class I SAM-dependent methyltransferase [Thermoanaerobaculia bacterium]|nr:class I SAM-dependent methyltransferase [Thermoanaerobaculia bacterium]
MKRYDRAYFDKWYRRVRVHSTGEMQRKVAMAVSVCEYFLRRRIRNVLDVGCGEGAWFPHLRTLRPRISYLGFDPSDYAVARFGPTRNVRKGSFADLDVDRRYDLVICSDVMHYLNERELKQGLPALVRATGGLAFLEVLTSEEEILGDLEGLIRRPVSWYRKLFSEAGLVECGPYCWLPQDVAEEMARLEVR